MAHLHAAILICPTEVTNSWQNAAHQQPQSLSTAASLKEIYKRLKTKTQSLCPFVEKGKVDHLHAA